MTPHRPFLLPRCQRCDIGPVRCHLGCEVSRNTTSVRLGDGRKTSNCFKCVAEAPSAFTHQHANNHDASRADLTSSARRPRIISRRLCAEAMMDHDLQYWQESRVTVWLDGLRDSPPLPACSSSPSSVNGAARKQASTPCHRGARSDTESLGILEYWTQKIESERRLSRRWSETATKRDI